MTLPTPILERLKALASHSGCELIEAPAATERWLRDHSRLPPELIQLLASAWPKDELDIGPYDLWNLQELSDSDWSKLAFSGGYFCIGAAGNGDLLVVRRGTESVDICEIGLISHEEFWENRSALDAIYEPICNGFNTLLKEAQVEDALPMDFYDARARRKA